MTGQAEACKWFCTLEYVGLAPTLQQLAKIENDILVHVYNSGALRRVSFETEPVPTVNEAPQSCLSSPV